MYQALYRKYRPTVFSDVCGQEHITSVLKNQLINQKVSHAYLFCGSRGTGKTTCAKILAKAVNCENPQNGEPCNECPTCRGINEDRILDVVEMDAASNNGVDNIRRLCDEVQYLPSEAKKRVYIIDEVHMLSTSAFNALLKTIEEPPEHVLFILATTEVNDIPATILSRCQRFDFKRLSPQVIVERLMAVAGREGISLERDGAQLIAKLSDGAMRDALSLLEACQGHQGELNAETLPEILGVGSRESVLSLCRAVAEKNPTRVLHLIGEIYSKMSDFKEIIGEVLAVYRDLMVFKCVPGAAEFVNAYAGEMQEIESIASLLTPEEVLYQAEELESFYTRYDRIASEKKASCELLFLRLCNPSLSESVSALAARLSSLERRIKKGAAVSPVPDCVPSEETVPERKTAPVQKKPETPSEATEKKSSGYAYTLQLKNLLQNEPFLKPWVSQLRFEQDQNTLLVYASPFTKGMIVSVKGDEKIRAAAASLSPEISRVQMVEKSDEDQNLSSGLEDF